MKNHSLNKKSYYQRCPDNDKFYRKIFIRNNTYTGALQPHLSDPIKGNPPKDMEQIPPMMLQKMMRLQMSSNFA